MEANLSGAKRAAEAEARRSSDSTRRSTLYHQCLQFHSFPAVICLARIFQQLTTQSPSLVHRNSPRILKRNWQATFIGLGLFISYSIDANQG